MITHQQFLDAVADFEGLIVSRWQSDAAIVEAATSNGIDPAVFQKRIAREMSIESRVEKIRRDADHDCFLAVARSEVAKCKKRKGPYRHIGLFGEGAVDQIVEHVETTVGRPLIENEASTIEELWDRWIFDLKQQMKFGIEPRPRQPIGSD
jgi:hypothetical protein